MIPVQVDLNNAISFWLRAKTHRFEQNFFLTDFVSREFGVKIMEENNWFFFSNIKLNMSQNDAASCNR